MVCGGSQCDEQFGRHYPEFYHHPHSIQNADPDADQYTYADENFHTNTVSQHHSDPHTCADKYFDIYTKSDLNSYTTTHEHCNTHCDGYHVYANSHPNGFTGNYQDSYCDGYQHLYAHTHSKPSQYVYANWHFYAYAQSNIH